MNPPTSHPIHEITKHEIANMIHRILWVYGRQIRLSGLIYEEVRSILFIYLENAIQKLTLLPNFPKKVVREADVLQILPFVPSKTPHLKRCTKRSAKIDEELKLASKIAALMRQIQDGRPRLAEDMTALRDKIDDLVETKEKLHQSNQTQMDTEGSCFHFSTQKVSRVIELIANGAFTITDDACLLLQFDAEYYLTILFTNAFRTLRVAHHGNTLMPKHLSLTSAIMKTEARLRRPRREFPESAVSFLGEYIQIRDNLEIGQKDASPTLIEQLDRFNYLLIALVVEYASFYQRMDRQSIVTLHHVETAVYAILPIGLAKHAKTTVKQMNEKVDRSRVFDIQTELNIEPDAAQFLNQVVEYINAELIVMMRGLHSSASFYSQFKNDNDFEILKNHLEFVVIK
jgi:hypothetical protein